MSAPFNCIIVDDEPLAQEVIERFVSKITDLKLIKTCSNALEAFEVLHTAEVDLIFLDISMPVISGIDFLRSLKNPPAVIITSAHSDFALEGYELDVVDYLVKPIALERFIKAIDKVMEKKKNLGNYADKPKTDYMFVKADMKLVKIKYNDIDYIEGMKDYVKIYTKEKMIVTLMTMKWFEANLPSHQFMRIHKSYIINVEGIKTISGHEVEIAKTKLPIGSMYKENLQKLIN